jgi:hypothetical protein
VSVSVVARTQARRRTNRMKLTSASRFVTSTAPSRPRALLPPAFAAYPQRSLASIEKYNMDVLNPQYGGQQSNAPRYTPEDETLRGMFEAARADRIQSVRLQLRRALVSNGLIIVLSALLFAIHWRWLRGSPALKIGANVPPKIHMPPNTRSSRRRTDRTRRGSSRGRQTACVVRRE